VRLKRLQEEGYILGFRAVINHTKLKKEHVAFAEVRLSDTREEALDAFNSAIKERRTSVVIEKYLQNQFPDCHILPTHQPMSRCNQLKIKVIRRGLTLMFIRANRAIF